jgi:hypothetical protein
MMAFVLVSLHQCPGLSGSTSHMDDASSDDDDRPPTPFDIWLSPGSQSATPRMKRRLHGSGHYQVRQWKSKSETGSRNRN